MSDMPDFMREFDTNTDYGFTPVSTKPAPKKVVAPKPAPKVEAKPTETFKPKTESTAKKGIDAALDGLE